jgi:hypothetical protein
MSNEAPSLNDYWSGMEAVGSALIQTPGRLRLGTRR